MTTTAKEKLFAMYYGQIIMCIPGVKYLIDCYNLSTVIRSDGIKDAYLLLRSIKDITDNEAFGVAKLFYSGYPEFWRDIHGLEILAAPVNRRDLDTGHFSYSITDYLRSIGIALPFTTVEDGKPVTYSVEQQIENGWIKINPKSPSINK